MERGIGLTQFKRHERQSRDGLLRRCDALAHTLHLRPGRPAPLAARDLARRNANTAVRVRAPVLAAVIASEVPAALEHLGVVAVDGDEVTPEVMLAAKGAVAVGMCAVVLLLTMRIVCLHVRLEVERTREAARTLRAAMLLASIFYRGLHVPRVGVSMAQVRR